jgi:hypothetical protein
MSAFPRRVEASRVMTWGSLVSRSMAGRMVSRPACSAQCRSSLRSGPAGQPFERLAQRRRRPASLQRVDEGGGSKK